jgi:diaminohydroxyphosphoribosylaminopyrimidine deaminase / 5-amino-6-(5-phosphoribosylamino)uracil reductase
VAGTAPTQADAGWLAAAIDLSRQCPPSPSAFSVGAILVAADGTVIATGYSRECDSRDHAEEVALARAAAPSGGGPAPAQAAGGLTAATMYTSLEPCRSRLSRPRSCSELIVAAGIRRVVLAWLEPPVFVPGGGARWLREQGVTVAQIPELAQQARAVNAHLLRG